MRLAINQLGINPLKNLTNGMDCMNNHLSYTQEADTIEIDSSSASAELLAEVAEWKLEAKNEDNLRYFYHVKELASIESGRRSYVIGRKGSGKTAISEYLGSIHDHETFAAKLTFKNFPFNALYSLKNETFASPNQYITLWKYLIYSTICQMMLKNQNIAASEREKLEFVFGDDNLTLDRRISKWTAREFQVAALSFNVKIGRGSDEKPEAPWIERATILEDFILGNIDTARYYIIFDELDEDYRGVAEVKKFEEYTSLITSLFKAVQDIKSRFKDNKYRVMPVIFLRDDIYEILQDSDKNKWNDFRIELNWDETKARDLVAFRISRALDPASSKPLPFDEAWTKLIGTATMGYGTHKKNSMDSFSYIARSTYLRPRDFVKFLQECASRAAEAPEGKVSAEIIRAVDTAFSNYLRDELKDELFSIVPQINEIFDTLTYVGKWNLNYSDFSLAYRKLHSENASATEINFIVQILFLFSVIGTALNHDHFVFKYVAKDAQMNYKNRIIVHRGLFKSLQIF